MNPYASATVVKLEESVEVCFDGFADLPAQKGVDYFFSPTFTCFQHDWVLELSPGGWKTSHDGNVAIYLQHRSAEPIELQVDIAIRDSPYSHTFKMRIFPPNVIRGFQNFADRAGLIRALRNGSLIIDVVMKRVGTSAARPFIPSNPLSTQILAKFMDEESADVVFEVESHGRDDSAKRGNETQTTFHAHRFVLQQCSSTLGELCKTLEGALPTVQISDVEPEIFSLVLFYCYGGAISDEDLENNAKGILDAADRFGVVNLKLLAEASLVDSTPITIANAIDFLLYADGKNCALLKEAVVDFLVENGDEAVEKLSFDDVPGSVVKDVLAAMNREKQKEPDAAGFSTMRVSDLRRMLSDKGLDVDCSREAMIAQLKQKQPEI